MFIPKPFNNVIYFQLLPYEFTKNTIAFAVQREGHELHSILTPPQEDQLFFGLKATEAFSEGTLWFKPFSGLADNKILFDEAIQLASAGHTLEKIVLAQETQAHSPTQFARLTGLFDPGIAVETLPHSEFKQRSKGVKAVIRTGDFTAYSNILLVSAGGPRWFVEQR